MKNRIISILLAVVLILSVVLIGCGGEAVPEITEYNLTISSTEGGSVTTPGEGTFRYNDGSVVDLDAEAEAGYHFANWSGDVNTVGDVNAATTTITMSDHCSITASFGRGPAIPLKNPGSFVQMTLWDVESFDPAWGIEGATWEQVQYIYETLLSYDGENTDQFVPVLATEWELLDDNVTYRFKIREGVKFHNGNDLTPGDVEYSFERAMVQDPYPALIFTLYQTLLGLMGSRDGDDNFLVTFDQIDNAVEVDGDWVVFRLVDPAWHLAFLQILCSSWASIVDKEWCVANGEWDGTAATWEAYNNPGVSDSYLYDHTNGTGPWKLEEWQPGIQIKLVRNDDYWRRPAPFEWVITRFIEDWTIRNEALLAGDADFVIVPSGLISWYGGGFESLEDCLQELDGVEDLNVHQDLPENMIDAFFFNFNIGGGSEFIGSGALDGNGIPQDFFSDIDVRKGFNYAFDWETYIHDAYVGEAQQVGSPVIEGLPFYNPDASMYSLDLAKAEEHLRLAWDGEVWEKGFKLTLPYSISRPPREIACKILAENLHAINPKFQVSIQPLDWRTGIFPGIRSGLVPMFQMLWAADYPHPDNLVAPFMASYGVFPRLQGYGYPELDELIEGAFKELDPAAQKDMYYEMQERYYGDAPAIMLCQWLGRRYFTKYIHGFYFNPMIPGQAGPLYYMSKSSS